jgi:hypothetical protein
MNEPEEVQEVLERLSALAPGAADAPRSPTIALAQFKQQIALRQGSGASYKRSTQIMSKRRLAAVGLTLVLAVTVLMAFPSVRAAAGEFLGLFRVQKFAPISITPQQMVLLNQLEEEGMTPGEFVTTTEPGESQPVESVAAAADLTGYEVRSLSNGDAPSEVYVRGDAAGYLLVNLAGARAIVEAAGADPLLLPDSLDGGRIDVNVYAAVQQIYPDGLMLMQTLSPDVQYPNDVDPTLLGEAVLQVLGNDPATARNIAQSIDWTSTMLLPIPQDLGTYREVAIDGVTGVALIPFDPDSDPAILWQKDGMVYALTGPFFVDELIERGNAIQ